MYTHESKRQEGEDIFLEQDLSGLNVVRSQPFHLSWTYTAA